MITEKEFIQNTKVVSVIKKALDKSYLLLVLDPETKIIKEQVRISPYIANLIIQNLDKILKWGKKYQEAPFKDLPFDCQSLTIRPMDYKQTFTYEQMVNFVIPKMSAIREFNNQYNVLHEEMLGKIANYETEVKIKKLNEALKLMQKQIAKELGRDEEGVTV